MMPLAWGARVSPEFRSRVVAMCARLGIVNPSWLMACMAFETGRAFSPSVRNAVSGATGLIQFMPSTARSLGTTVEALAALTAEQQLTWVEKYFAPQAGRINSLSDLYMAILWPAAVGKPEDFPLFKAGTAAYAQNRGLDLDADHVVTKAEATAFVQKQLEAGLLPENAAAAEVGTQPAAPIEERGKPYTPEPQPQESAMGAGLILSLVQSILPMFTGGAQAKIGPILAGVTAPPTAASGDAKTDAIIQLATGIMASMLTASGHANPAQATDQQKIAATAAVAANPALVQKVEDDAMARLEKMAPTFDRLIAIDKATNEASIAGKDAAAARSLLDRWDMTETLVRSSEYLTYLIVVLGGGLIGAAIYKDKWEVALSVLAVVGGWITLILRNRSQAYDYRFDGTPSSNAANAINAEIAQRK